MGRTAGATSPNVRPGNQGGRGREPSAKPDLDSDAAEAYFCTNTRSSLRIFPLGPWWTGIHPAYSKPCSAYRAMISRRPLSSDDFGVVNGSTLTCSNRYSMSFMCWLIPYRFHLGLYNNLAVSNPRYNRFYNNFQSRHKKERGT